MARFAIRDDDTSFFTKPEELESVYGGFWGRVPVSLAVVPFSCPEYKEISFGVMHSSGDEVPLEENKELVNWILEKIRYRHVEVMLHGFNHRYVNANGRWVGEYAWKSEGQLMEETKRGKAYLESLLGTKIKVFVPPSNSIGKAGINAIRSESLNLSGIMGRGGDRPFTWDYPLAYLKRWSWRIFRGDAYPFPMSYGGITELRAHSLTPGVNPEDLIKSLQTCSRINAPFVLATHYWEFKNNPGMHKALKMVVDECDKNNMTFSKVSSCYGGINE